MDTFYPTPRVEADLDEARAVHERIEREGADLFRAIDKLVRAYGERHSCEVSGTLEYIDGAITDLVSDATGPSWRKICRLEDEVGRLDDAELRRNAPVVL